jgi:hypothetical protein
LSIPQFQVKDNARMWPPNRWSPDTWHNTDTVIWENFQNSRYDTANKLQLGHLQCKWLNEFLNLSNHILFYFIIRVGWYDIQSGLEIGDETSWSNSFHVSNNNSAIRFWDYSSNDFDDAIKNGLRAYYFMTAAWDLLR